LVDPTWRDIGTVIAVFAMSKIGDIILIPISDNI
jgi:hypothetical protein